MHNKFGKELSRLQVNVKANADADEAKLELQ